MSALEATDALFTSAAFAGHSLAAALDAAGPSFAFDRWLAHPALAGAAALLVTLPPALWLTNRMLRGWSRQLRAVADGIGSLRDRDYSVSVTPTGPDEIGDLTSEYNALGDSLRRERLDLHQRELLLDTVVQTTPLALVLTNPNDQVVFGNIAARQLFRGGRKLEGLRFGELLDAAPEPLREAVAGGVDTLFTVNEGADAEIYHVSSRPFTLNSQPHRLLLFKQLTRELAAQEVAIWKKVIRVIAHELNNSLAPITSLAHSGAELLRRGDHEKLGRIFDTIEERARHLHGFLRGYSSVAKLPVPELEPVEWAPFLSRLQQHYAFERGPIPEAPARFDPAQVEQALINVLKNAHESGSAADAVTLTVRQIGRVVRLEVSDRGPGMSDAVLANALVPFYSTKRTGSGLGLALAREIAEAHGGRISLSNREGGGLAVAMVLPEPG